MAWQQKMQERWRQWKRKWDETGQQFQATEDDMDKMSHPTAAD